MSDAERVAAWAAELGEVPQVREVKKHFGWGSNRAHRAVKAVRGRQAVTFEERGSVATFHARMAELGDPEQLLRDAGIDTDLWEITKIRLTHHEAFRRAERKKLKFHEGRIGGKVTDDGEITVKPLFNVTIELRRRRDVDRVRMVAEATIEAMREHVPAVVPPRAPQRAPDGHGCLLEVAVPDLHLGKLAWAAETGASYDTRIAEQAFRAAVLSLLARASGDEVTRVLFPIGNDLLHVDGPENTTTKGTRQDVDSRWQRCFRRALELMVWAIDTLHCIAPVDVVTIPGNHASVLEHVMGEALRAWYRQDGAVTIDAGVTPRRYRRWGRSLLGLTHGHATKHTDLPLIMAEEVPDLWAATKYREWHLGHLHHRRETTTRYPGLVESHGVVVRVIPSLCAADAWHAEHGYTGSLRAAQAFLWHPEEGIVAQYTSAYRPEAGEVKRAA